MRAPLSHYAPHARLNEVGVSHPLVIGANGFTINTGDVNDLLQTGPFSERRVYRNGTIKVREEITPNAIYQDVASYSSCVFTLDIDYATNQITNQIDCVRSFGSNEGFPESWRGRSRNPINRVGNHPEVYGTFAVTGEMVITPR